MVATQPAPSPVAPSAGAAPLGRPAAPLDADQILERFLAYASGKGLSLYPAQEEALFEILADKHVVLATPTGSGKSLVATAFLYKALCDGVTGFYSCPVKALVNFVSAGALGNYLTISSTTEMRVE